MYHTGIHAVFMRVAGAGMQRRVRCQRGRRRRRAARTDAVGLPWVILDPLNLRERQTVGEEVRVGEGTAGGGRQGARRGSSSEGLCGRAKGVGQGGWHMAGLRRGMGMRRGRVREQAVGSVKSGLEVVTGLSSSPTGP